MNVVILDNPYVIFWWVGLFSLLVMVAVVTIARRKKEVSMTVTFVIVYSLLSTCVCSCLVGILSVYLLTSSFAVTSMFGEFIAVIAIVSGSVRYTETREIECFRKGVLYCISGMMLSMGAFLLDLFI